MSVPLVKITLTEDQGRQLDHLPATQTLSVTSAHRIEWVRGGSSPEATQVTFEASTNGGTSYLPLGGGTRITGGWELTGINLPASGLLRARARTGSGSLLETVTPFSGLLAPEIASAGDDDGDSITNLLEFAFGTDPAGGASGPAPTQVVNGTITRHGTPATFAATGGGMQALFGRRNDWSSAGLSYAVQFSADLSAWETSTTTLTVIADDGEIEAVTVPYPTLIGGLEARFFRLSVTLNP